MAEPRGASRGPVAVMTIHCKPERRGVTYLLGSLPGLPGLAGLRGSLWLDWVGTFEMVHVPDGSWRWLLGGSPT